ncbi:sigma factor-like helix-turn-helix DNA-binding protein, partial [Leifsonia sp. SIMBA_070]|uniref:sigma factor-like helix-turn-helix DNA-binding protein n=1 Tax=Leifsonia sp. SIMBA_070 TaxID=3085810 RepID=UPI0039795366
MDEAPEPADDAPLATDLLMEGDRAATLEEGLSALPERQRAAIVLVHLEEMSNIDAAAAMEVSVEALESLLARGRRGLKK